MAIDIIARGMAASNNSGNGGSTEFPKDVIVEHSLSMLGSSVDKAYGTALGQATISYSQNSMAEGSQTIAGGNGFQITAVADNGDGTGTYTLSSVDGIEVGMRYSVILKTARFDAGTITNISSNIIIVDNYEHIELNTAKNDFENYNVYNFLIITGHPELGDIEVGFNSHAEGQKTQAVNKSTHAEGFNTLALGKFAHAEGSTTIAGHAAHAEGNATKALGSGSHAEGDNSIANGHFSHAEGNLSKANGKASHAEGQSTANGDRSHSEGHGTLAEGIYSHAEGYRAATSIIAKPTAGNVEALAGAIGDYSHAEGQNTAATGKRAHAEGDTSIASGNTTHAEGFQTVASGDYAHAEGYQTIASGNYSHSEGENTQATAARSHAEGKGSVASGNASHAEGEGKATGNRAHAEGSGAASGAYSHAGGINTIASAEGQTAIGKYNQENPDALFIVGNGTADSRSNAFEVVSNEDGVAVKIGNTILSETKLMQLLTLLDQI